MTTPDPPPTDPPREAPAPAASLRQVVGAVFWSFFGVRKGKHMEQDALTIRPLRLVLVALLSALVLVLALIGLVTFITRQA
jgi:Protein of unknown function (DUF2970)